MVMHLETEDVYEFISAGDFTATISVRFNGVNSYLSRPVAEGAGLEALFTGSPFWPSPPVTSGDIFMGLPVGFPIDSSSRDFINEALVLWAQNGGTSGESNDPFTGGNEDHALTVTVIYTVVDL